MKHAYLIMAANEFEELLVLLKALDYEDNAIFLHIDKKAALSSLQLKRFKQQVSKADFYLAPRKKVSWGGRDMLECEFSLFSFARSVGPFDYYHLLSGKDLPLLSHKRISEFFEKNKGREFVEYKPIKEQEVWQRVQVWHAFPNVSAYRSVKSAPLKLIIRAYRKLERTLAKALKLDFFKNTGLKLGFGSQWLSLDDFAVERILKKEKSIMKIFKHAIVADELFLQTFILNDEVLKKRLYQDEKGRPGNLRFIKIDEKKSSPLVWKISDLKTLEKARNEGYLFSRKFDVAEDDEIVSSVLKMTAEEE